jgi:hypothetical protein
MEEGKTLEQMTADEFEETMMRITLDWSVMCYHVHTDWMDILQEHDASKELARAILQTYLFAKLPRFKPKRASYEHQLEAGYCNLEGLSLKMLLDGDVEEAKIYLKDAIKERIARHREQKLPHLSYEEYAAESRTNFQESAERWDMHRPTVERMMEDDVIKGMYERYERERVSGPSSIVYIKRVIENIEKVETVVRSAYSDMMAAVEKHGKELLSS